MINCLAYEPLQIQLACDLETKSTNTTVVESAEPTNLMNNRLRQRTRKSAKTSCHLQFLQVETADHVSDLGEPACRLRL